jgi:hypothetical protein
MRSGKRAYLLRHVTVRLSSANKGSVYVMANAVRIGCVRRDAHGKFRFGFRDPACETPGEVLGWLADETAGKRA